MIRVEGAATMGASKKFSSYGITIDGDDQYELAVELALHRIEVSYTGKVLLSAIKSTSKSIQIVPFTPSDKDKCNAYADPMDLVAATPSNQYQLEYDSKNERYTFRPEREANAVRWLLGLPQEPVKGKGTGSDATVYFSATMWGYGVRGDCAQFAGAPGASPSLVLFHELAHAYRAARGVFYPRPTIGTSRSYDNMEEFFAVVLSNVLATDPTFGTANRTPRADHGGFQPLANNLSTSKGFVASTPNRNMMKELAESEPDLVKALRGSPSTFNPFAEPLDAAVVVVASGDSLSSLAAKYYGTVEYWPLLWDANRDLVGPNPNRIALGMRLSVPPLSYFTQAQLADARRRFPTWRNY
ncbi:MAG: M91 family zinc metallopeptidase [Terracidiphilus sp.]|jgi:hypothetical protein